MTKRFLVPVLLPGDPTNALEAAPKQYVDARTLYVGPSPPADPNVAEIWWDTDEALVPGLDVVTADSLYINVGGDTMTGPLVLNADPSALLGAATKQYVDTGDSRPTVMRVYTSSGTWTKPANLKSIFVRCQAGGGGSGGTPLTAASQVAVGGGGGGGGYCEEMIAASSLGATETYAVGAGGLAGTTSGAGGTGGTTSFGTTPYLTASGGAGGPLGVVLTPPSLSGGGTAGGGASGGQINYSGGNSFSGVLAGVARATRSVGGGAVMAIVDGTGVSTTTSAAAAGTAYGGGATGGCNCQSQGTALAGAVGGAGICVVIEYY